MSKLVKILVVKSEFWSCNAKICQILVFETKLVRVIVSKLQFWFLNQNFGL